MPHPGPPPKQGYVQTLLGNGRFWTRWRAAWTGVWFANLPVALTVWKRSLEYLTFISVMALVLSCAAAFQSSLTMRKADPDDPL